MEQEKNIKRKKDKAGTSIPHVETGDSENGSSSDEKIMAEETSNGAPVEPELVKMEEINAESSAAQRNSEMEVESEQEIPSGEKPAETKEDSPAGGNNGVEIKVETELEIPSAETKTESPAESNPIENKVESEEKVPSAETMVEPPAAKNNSAETKVESGQETPSEKPAETKDNSVYVSSQLDKLTTLQQEHNFTDFWFYVKELNKMVFTLRGLSKEERHTFKERIGELCDEAKKIQDELKAKVAKTSHLKLDRIQQILDEALSFGSTHEELEKSFHKIEEANKFLKEGKVKAEDGQESADMSRDHREQAKELIKKGKDKIFDRKREIREGNFKRVTERLNAISDSLMSPGKSQKIFDGIKNLRVEMRSMILDRSQLREIDDVIETIWKKAREKSSAGRVNDTRKKIHGLEDLARRKETFIKTLEQEIKDLNLKWATVQNDFFKNRVNEWIGEKKEKIEATRKEIESVHEKVKFLTDQMNRT